MEVSIIHLKPFLVKVNRDTDMFDVIEIPRTMTKWERASFERVCKTRFSDYTFSVGYDMVDAVARVLGVTDLDDRYLSDEEY